MARRMSSKSSGTTHEVFLNFRGKDTRQGFTNCLYHSMDKAGICTFMDDESMWKGDPISDALYGAIEDCKIYVCIFSTNYASSTWCLRELKRMLDLMDSTKEKTILPVFYDVEVDHVKLKKGRYKKHLAEQKKKLAEKLKEKEEAQKAVEEWEKALIRVAGLKGYRLGKQGFTEFMESIVTDVLLMLKDRSVTKHPIQIEGQEMSKLLDIGCGDVRFIGIHGVGGVGKTTLARSLFDQLSDQFDGCCFLEKVGELSKQKAGLAFLKDQLLTSTPDVDQDKTMREKFRNKKVLFVLDDVTEWKQITQLVGRSYWFGPGSRIIVTAREGSSLTSQNQVQEISLFLMEEMDHDRALKLFSRHAFGRESPPAEYRSISIDIVADIRRIPLVLEVIGSFLHRKGRQDWIELKHKVQGMSRMEVKEKLMISYEKLTDEAKEVFLDIACFFADIEKTKPLYMWEACYLGQGKKALGSLLHMSLVKVLDNGKLWMHDEVRDLGRSIVETEKRLSRLWMPKDALDMLNNDQLSEETEALHLSLDPSLERWAAAEDFKKLREIRFIQMDGANFEGEDWTNCLLKLKWLALSDSTGKNFKATKLSLGNLVILDLSWSSIKDDWRGWAEIQATSLKVLDLTDCKYLTGTPDLSGYIALERLVIQGCKKLKEIHTSIGKLKKLTHLNAMGCDSLAKLPEEICFLTELQEIRVGKTEQTSLVLPKSIGNELKSLLTLEIANVKIDRLPESIGKLEKLEHLYMRRCYVEKTLPDSLGDLKSLIEFDLSGAEIPALPDTIFFLKKLKSMKLTSSSIEDFAHKHTSAEETPSDINAPPCLTVLDLSGTGICRLPEQISNLTQLQTLRLGSQKKIKQLPKLPKSLTSLHIRSLAMVPDLSELENLTDLLITVVEDSSSTEQKTTNWDWIGRLSKLKSLQLHFPTANSLLLRLAALTQLNTLDLSVQNVQGGLELPCSLKSLSVRHFRTLLPNLASLKNLSILRCYDCVLSNGGDNSFTITELRHLTHFSAENCDIRMVDGLSLPGSLAVLSITNCDFTSSEGRAKSSFVNLSGLTSLKQLKLSYCKDLTEVRGLGDLESLQELIVQHCNDLKMLGTLSNLKLLEVLELLKCKKLHVTEPRGLKFLKLNKIIGVRVSRTP